MSNGDELVGEFQVDGEAAKAMKPIFLTTPNETGIPNQTTPLTEEIGQHLVRLALGGEQPEGMCGGCAFRLGSFANRSYTSHDALMCLVSGKEFECHYGEDRPCAGFQRAAERNKKIG